MTFEYLDLIRKILNANVLTKNRTGVDTFSCIGHQMRFDLRENTLPMITTKKVNFDLILKELLWFLRADTNQEHLENAGVKIWKANASREFLDSRKLYKYKENKTLGPIYGFQWRHFGAKYIDDDTDYTGQGIDQLRNVYNALKNDPTSRRIIMSAWNPMDLEAMALPPCHCFVQFFVNPEAGELSSMMYQRSADVMLGVPFNITSYALLTHILAHATGLKAREFIHTMGDVHIYENHVKNAKLQLTRIPHPAPKIVIDFPTNVDFNEMINNLTVENFKLTNYVHDESIFYKMAV